jgi:hypothetical protein
LSVAVVIDRVFSVLAYKPLYNLPGQERVFAKKTAEGAMRADFSGMNAQAKGLATARG